MYHYSAITSSMYPISQIAQIVAGSSLLARPDALIEHLLTDSRRLVFPATTLFFALQTKRRSGALFIGDLYQQGVRNFVVSGMPAEAYPDANWILVPNTLTTLHQLVSYHRRQFNIPVIGITGSNGKTMVKEWLYQLLNPHYNIVRSPKSYNSQVGVPLSVWQMNGDHNLALFEAGISQPGEMERLQTIIAPTIGVLTNIGAAHKEGFTNDQQKALEKSRLFKGCSKVIYCSDSAESIYGLQAARISSHALLYAWSRHQPAALRIIHQQSVGSTTAISALFGPGQIPVTITIPFTDQASVDNAITCWLVLLQLDLPQATIQKRMRQLQPVEMRMQLKRGINNCQLINDSYNNDLSSLGLALDYVSRQAAGRKTTVILSDILQSGLPAAEWCSAIAVNAKNRGVDRLILIGPVMNSQREQFAGFRSLPGFQKLRFLFYPSTNSFIKHANTLQFRDEVILLKGARVFEFERISRWLEDKVHQTVMEVNLNAMMHNLAEFQRYINPATKVMAMVKAFSYGSGSAEVARALQYRNVDYLAVAYADEGVELRKAGINMPIMVMSPEINTFDAMVNYNLEPEIYSFSVLRSFDAYVAQQGLQQYPVHIKLDTGMHRLGFEPDEVPKMLQVLQSGNRLIVKSVFSHLAASENNVHDEFTLHQAAVFKSACQQMAGQLNYSFLRHLSNSAAIFRHPELQFDMVRLGIGLYGVDSLSENQLQLQPVAALKSTIAQVRQVPAGESVGYSRRGVVQHNAVIATVRIGYADGVSRRMSNGNGSMYIKGKLAPVVGNVCMDMTMIDVTGIDGVTEGDEVEVFGNNLPVNQVARWCETIPYEILTGINQRVKRIYYEE